MPFYTAETVVYIPESAVPALKAAQAQRGYKIPYTIKTYSGNDVYAAQKAGDAAAKDNWCTAHQYTLQIRTADRVYTYAQACHLPGVITIPAPSAASASTMQSMSLPIPRIRRSCSRQKSSPTRITASIPRRRPTSA